MKRFMTSLSPAVALVVCLASGAFATPLEEGVAAFDAADYDVAFAEFTAGVEAGDATSGYYLARMLELGLGVEPDAIAAVRLYRQAAQGGEVKALNRVALMYYRGESGVAQDYPEAARLFDLAAEQGDRNALFNLGKLYLAGEGVEQDPARAMSYFKQAADQDHILALNTLGALYRAGAKNAEDRAQSNRYFERSAAFGNAVGLFEMARVSLEDAENPARQIEAHMYLNLASARGHPNAPAALQALTDVMSLTDIEAAQAKARGFVAISAAGEN